jgi:hypothetical protein
MMKPCIPKSWISDQEKKFIDPAFYHFSSSALFSFSAALASAAGRDVTCLANPWHVSSAALASSAGRALGAL